MANEAGDSQKKVGTWQIVMLFLSIYVLAALFVDSVATLPKEVSLLLKRIDNLVCFAFIGDFIYNLVTAKKKLGYLKWGWIDLISSIPDVDFLRWGRFVRIFRILRILRGVRSVRKILGYLFENRAQGALTSVSLICFVLVVFSSIAMLEFEKVDAGANIKTAGDALWWSYVTVTTVGYGDKYPVTVAGRMLGAVLMTAGIGLFGTFTAYVASAFLNPAKKEEETREEEILAQISEVNKRLDRLEKKD